MATLRVNKKALYEKILEQCLIDENYESAAATRDILRTIKGDEVIEIDDMVEEPNDSDEDKLSMI